jgi:hypothetical protein
MISHKIVPNISVDCVVFGFDFEKLNVLLVERQLKDKKRTYLIHYLKSVTNQQDYESEYY